MMTVYKALNLVIGFGHLVVTIILIVVTILSSNKNK
ncbi:putative holin-like toxin [Ammoniphilus resinae]|uniref:Holin-like toxin n=1 Tax=Ammoniphilus resinae TaxID=861532 RepID=A0ABS4GSQ9_9BACL|nr:putative holin-like toxin [Ammoniphilus resinae]MBP1933264.1 hypothetical protein [Ammoniphilus resinae]